MSIMMAFTWVETNKGLDVEMEDTPGRRFYDVNELTR